MWERQLYSVYWWQVTRGADISNNVLAFIEFMSLKIILMFFENYLGVAPQT